MPPSASLSLAFFFSYFIGQMSSILKITFCICFTASFLQTHTHIPRNNRFVVVAFISLTPTRHSSVDSFGAFLFFLLLIHLSERLKRSNVLCSHGFGLVSLSDVCISHFHRDAVIFRLLVSVLDPTQFCTLILFFFC